MEIRQAKLEDREQILNLLWIIMEDMELPLLKEIPTEVIKDWLRESMAKMDYRYSMRRITVADISGKVVGLAVCYAAEDEDAIDEEFEEITKKSGYDIVLFEDKEAMPNEWYLDSLVVDENYRGQGIATKLLEKVKEEAKKAGKNKVGLNVDFDNPKAKKLYEKVGFETVCEMTLSNHKYSHMQCKV